MFTSHGVVSKNSPAYSAWLAGVSRKQLKRQDLNVDIDAVIKAVEKLGMNFKAISICTLGIVKIHDGKATVLLSDCQRASQLSKSLKFDENAPKYVPLKIKTPTITEIPDMDSIGDICTQGSSYFDSNKIIPPTTRAEITLHDNLPMSQFTISNFEDFGNEGQLDFDISYSQVFNEQNSQSSGQRDLEIVEGFNQAASDIDIFGDVGSESIENSDEQKDGNNNEQNAKIPTPVDSSCDQPAVEVSRNLNKFTNDFTILAPSDIDEGISMIDSQNALSDAKEPPSMMDLSSLKSFSSSVNSESRRRKRKSIFDEKIVIGQHQMREHVDDFSDIVLKQPDIAPPTKKLMRIKMGSDYQKLLTTCHVNGVNSQRSPPARMLSFLSRQALESHRMRSFKLPSELEEIFDILEVQKMNTEHLNEINQNEEPQSVEKWLEANNLENGNDILIETPFVDANFDLIQPMEEPQLMDIEVEKDLDSKKSKAKKSVTPKIDRDEENPVDAIHDAILAIIVENVRISVDSIMKDYYKNNLDRKRAARVFMKILELKKIGKIDVSQNEPNGEIIVNFIMENQAKHL